MMAETHLDGSTIQKRRSDRVFICIPLSIVSTDQNGRDFEGRAVTQMVARFGASIVTKLSLSPEQELTLIPADKKRIRARVIGQTGIGTDGHVYGIAFLNTTIDFWGIHFPPFAQAASASTPLECCNCHACESVRLNELEFEVFRANDRLRRLCSHCGDITTWQLAEAATRKPAQPSHNPQAQAAREQYQPDLGLHSEAPPASDAPNTQGPQRKERMYPRVRVKMKACIAEPGADEDIVNTINMSRGGVLVRSERVHSTESWIQLAVPYTPAAANIFVPARIVRRADVQGAYEYGIKYVRC